MGTYTTSPYFNGVCNFIYEEWLIFTRLATVYSVGKFTKIRRIVCGVFLLRVTVRTQLTIYFRGLLIKRCVSYLYVMSREMVLKSIDATHLLAEVASFFFISVIRKKIDKKRRR